MAIRVIYTIDFGASFTFTDATGVTFVRKDSIGNIIEQATNVSHYQMSPPARYIKYQLDWLDNIQGGDDANIVVFNYDGTGNYSGVPAKELTCLVCYTGYPIWSTDDLPDANWTVGEDIGLVYGTNLNDNITMNGDIPNTSFSIYPTSISPNNDQLPIGTTLNPDGTITGVVAAQQGGDYNMDFDAANPFGHEVTSQKIALTIGLPIVAPTLGDIPALGNTEQGAAISVDCASYLTDDGNPSGTETLVWSLDATSDTIVGCFMNASTGVYSGNISNATSTGTLTIVAKVTNSADLSDTDGFAIPIISSASASPVVVGWFSGNASCSNVVIPTWSAGGDTFFIASDDDTAKSIDMLGLYLASDGNGAITDVALASGVLDPEWSLDAITGFLNRQATLSTIGNTNITLTATNSAGASDPSNTFTINIYDNAAVVPTIVSISADDGSNDVFVNMSEPCYTVAGDAASYELGFAFKVNTLTRNHTYISGGGTNQLRFTLDGAAFSANNTIDLTYTT